MQNRKDNVVDQEIQTEDVKKPEKEVTPKPAPTIANYKQAIMAGSATLCLITLATRLHDGEFSSYLALGSFLTSSGFAVHELGFEKTKQIATNTAITLSKTAVSLFNSTKAAINARLNKHAQAEEIPTVQNHKRLN